MSRLLDQINGPADLKGLTLRQLEQLAKEVRQELLKVVSNNGGHLASNLGVVELTIVLHSLLDSPRDKIIWDVGHQSYVHKLLTGRKERFSTIRQYGGLAGFPDPEESPHDIFGTGHASTSISAALGIAQARDLSKENHHVVAVIGDGALTGGIAFEALNHAGHLGTRLIVILNDNAMSISPNIGALAHYLNKVRLDPRYHHIKGRTRRFLARSTVGTVLSHSVKRIKDGIKSLFFPPTLWETLGFTYIGPIDGHNLIQLRVALSRALQFNDKPTLIRVITQKGKGYAPAERDAVKFHGLSPNNNNDNKSKSISYTEVFGKTVLQLVRDNPKIVVITAAMKEGTGTNLVAQHFPERVFDVGICEQHAVTFAAGLASQGYIPIAAIYSTFLQRAFDQVLHDVCIQNLPVVFALDRAGIVGEDGKTHQGTFDLSYLGSIPNLVIAAPKDENELQHLLYTAVKARRPMAVRYPRGNGVGVPLDEELREIPVGQGEVLRWGEDVVILALGSTVYPALEAAQTLAAGGIQCTVVNARYVKPLDSPLVLKLLNGTQRVVTLEENVLTGGFGSAVLGLLADADIKGKRLIRIGLPDEFVQHGSQEQLRLQYRLTASSIAHRIRSSFPELALLEQPSARSKL
ncbi:MAG: 1-deoxy-D-xylulose-5-phosphate synthase [Chloroflexi bacterium]|nr:1-deoxy-D-xylulose-5-phosphate synthase [Chloroflexota bacterium]